MRRKHRFSSPSPSLLPSWRRRSSGYKIKSNPGTKAHSAGDSAPDSASSLITTSGCSDAEDGEMLTSGPRLNLRLSSSRNPASRRMSHIAVEQDESSLGLSLFHGQKRGDSALSRQDAALPGQDAPLFAQDATVSRLDAPAETSAWQVSAASTSDCVYKAESFSPVPVLVTTEWEPVVTTNSRHQKRCQAKFDSSDRARNGLQKPGQNTAAAQQVSAAGTSDCAYRVESFSPLPATVNTSSKPAGTTDGWFLKRSIADAGSAGHTKNSLKRSEQDMAAETSAQQVCAAGTSDSFCKADSFSSTTLITSTELEPVVGTKRWECRRKRPDEGSTLSLQQKPSLASVPAAGPVPCASHPLHQHHRQCAVSCTDMPHPCCPLHQHTVSRTDLPRPCCQLHQHTVSHTHLPHPCCQLHQRTVSHTDLDATYTVEEIDSDDSTASGRGPPQASDADRRLSRFAPQLQVSPGGGETPPQATSRQTITSQQDRRCSSPRDIQREELTAVVNRVSCERSSCTSLHLGLKSKTGLTSLSSVSHSSSSDTEREELTADVERVSFERSPCSSLHSGPKSRTGLASLHSVSYSSPRDTEREELTADVNRVSFKQSSCSSVHSGPKSMTGLTSLCSVSHSDASIGWQSSASPGVAVLSSTWVDAFHGKRTSPHDVLFDSDSNSEDSDGSFLRGLLTALAQETPARESRRMLVREGRKTPGQESRKPSTGEGRKTSTGEGRKTYRGEGRKTLSGEGGKKPVRTGGKTPAGKGRRTGGKTPAGEGRKTPVEKGRKTRSGEGGETPAREGRKTPVQKGRKILAGKGEETPAGNVRKTPVEKGRKILAGEGKEAPAGEGRKTPAEGVPAGRHATLGMGRRPGYQPGGVDFNSLSVHAVTDQKDSSILAVTYQKDNSVLAVTDQRDNSVLAVTDQRDNIVLAVKDQRNESVHAVTDRGDDSVHLSLHRGNISMSSSPHFVADADVIGKFSRVDKTSKWHRDHQVVSENDTDRCLMSSSRKKHSSVNCIADTRQDSLQRGTGLEPSPENPAPTAVKAESSSCENKSVPRKGRASRVRQQIRNNIKSGRSLKATLKRRRAAGTLSQTSSEREEKVFTSRRAKSRAKAGISAQSRYTVVEHLQYHFTKSPAHRERFSRDAATKASTLAAWCTKSASSKKKVSLLGKKIDSKVGRSLRRKKLRRQQETKSLKPVRQGRGKLSSTGPQNEEKPSKIISAGPREYARAGEVQHRKRLGAKRRLDFAAELSRKQRGHAGGRCSTVGSTLERTAETCAISSVPSSSVQPTPAPLTSPSVVKKKRKQRSTQPTGAGRRDRTSKRQRLESRRISPKTSNVLASATIAVQDAVSPSEETATTDSSLQRGENTCQSDLHTGGNVSQTLPRTSDQLSSKAPVSLTCAAAEASWQVTADLAGPGAKDKNAVDLTSDGLDVDDDRIMMVELADPGMSEKSEFTTYTRIRDLRVEVSRTLMTVDKRCLIS